MKNLIAIVGLGLHFPGARNAEEFWQRLEEGLDLSAPIPAQRLHISAQGNVSRETSPDKVRTLNAYLAPELADQEKDLDPVFRLPLEAASQALQGARLPDTRDVGLIMAAIALPTDATVRLTEEQWGEELRERLQKRLESQAEQEPSLRGLTLPGGEPLRPLAPHSSGAVGLTASLTASAFNLGGCAYTLDAACASSLTAVILACRELQQGRARAMLAGGLSRPSCLYTQMGFSALHALSPSGKCSPFDSRADGLMVGEGCGLVLLKRLEDALSDGDEVLAVIRGAGQSNDLEGSLVAPASEGQVRAMRQAYAQAGLSPRDMDLVECHGTGTPTGDRVEFTSLNQVWNEAGADGDSTKRTALTSVKAMVGHLLTAAGIAALLRVVLNLRHRTITAQPNFTSSDLPLDSSPFYVPTGNREWRQRTPGTPRRAAVSGFGFGGINAHLVLEEYLPACTPEAQDSAQDSAPATLSEVPVAIVGMAAHLGKLKNLQEFQEAVFQGSSALEPVSARRLGSHRTEGKPAILGAAVEEYEIPGGLFRIPPKDIPNISCQQSLMLSVAAQAMQDARLSWKEARPQAAAFIGISLDMNSSNFHLRWSLEENSRKWGRVLGLSENERLKWLSDLREDAGPILDSVRTMGNLGSIAASRVAREFRFGGSSYAVSADEASGLQALEIACRSLAAGELDLALAGAVDLGCDARLFPGGDASTLNGAPNGEPHPFDRRGGCEAPGEGAVAVVLMRLEDALKNKLPVYAVVKACAAATPAKSSTPREAERARHEACIKAGARALQEAALPAQAISYVETAGAGEPGEDVSHLEALNISLGQGTQPCALGALNSLVGRLHAAAGLAALVKAALALYHSVLPPLPGYVSPATKAVSFTRTESRLHIPQTPVYWAHNRADGPRYASVSCLTYGKGCFHTVLEESPHNLHRAHELPVCGEDRVSLFPVFGDNPQELTEALRYLREFAQDKAGAMPGSDGDQYPMSCLAREWWQKNSAHSGSRLCLTIISDSPQDLQRKIAKAQKHLASTPERPNERYGFYYFPNPVAAEGEVAFVYPGSGSHFVGMGRELGVRFHSAMRQLDDSCRLFADQCMARWSVPYLNNWSEGWKERAGKVLAADTHKMMFSQVSFGRLSTAIARSLGLKPQALLGYSLGESTAFFANGIWPDSDEMLEDMSRSDLFRQKLSGSYLAARQAWNIPADQPFDWTVAMIPLPKTTVEEALKGYPQARLLIVNTDDECVVGGTAEAINALTHSLNADAVMLTGVDCVHCDALGPVYDEYRDMHTLRVVPQPDLRVYSGYYGKAYPVSSASCADSIVHHGYYGFDYTKVVRQAWEDGVRVFIEMGPGASCTRMIRKILNGKPHYAASINMRGRSELVSLLHMLGGLLACGLRPDLDFLLCEPEEQAPASRLPGVTIKPGRDPFNPPLPQRSTTTDAPLSAPVQSASSQVAPAPCPLQPQAEADSLAVPDACTAGPATATAPAPPADDSLRPAPTPALPLRGLLGAVAQSMPMLAQAHDAWLRFAGESARALTDLMTRQSLLSSALPGCLPSCPGTPDAMPAPSAHDGYVHGGKPSLAPQGLEMALNREQCLQFAVGKIGDVLGSRFAPIDGNATRVRLPDEPLMLVDRILKIEGEPLSLGRGRVITEHDVIPGMWYLDGGRAPVFVSVEAGQADLFLSGWLGIDFKTHGERVYRLLDATVSFHRGLPQPGETIRYDIRIDRFVNQGDTWLFFFEYDGTINGETFLTMRKGCAGFFTHKEINENRGLVLTEKELAPQQGRALESLRRLVQLPPASYNQFQVEALHNGNLSACFGESFANLPLRHPVRLPGGLLKLIHRVTQCDRNGGRWGLGLVYAEADIHPDDWFLTCHFVDDQVMPGTLMYECCAHALRFLLTSMGWVCEHERVAYEPVPGVQAVLKCRGPVLRSTKVSAYQVEIKEIGANPYPYVIADAIMYADGKRIVGFQDISMQMTGLDAQELCAFWQQVNASRALPAPTAAPLTLADFPAGLEPGERPAAPDLPPRASGEGDPVKPAIYSRESLLQYAIGSPSLAFGPRFAQFDSRFIARLPGPPYQFVDRITSVDHPFMRMVPGGWVEAQYDVPRDAWYFAANRQPTMPFCVLLEIPLQVCGWVSSYSGSSTHNSQDLQYRNLGGHAVLYEEITPHTGTLTIRVRMTKASEAGGLIVQSFDMWMGQQGRTIYEGDTTFGYFTRQSLAHQLGVRNCQERLWDTDGQPLWDRTVVPEHPLDPRDPDVTPAQPSGLPGKALMMLDDIQWYPQGGHRGLGFVRGHKRVDVNEWFFKAHFYQDPVIPGSLGLESFLQLLKAAAVEIWPQYASSHRFECILTGEPHEWVYRGQVIPSNKLVTVSASITEVRSGDEPVLKADGFLQVDGLTVYEMKNFGLRMVRA